MNPILGKRETRLRYHIAVMFEGFQGALNRNHRRLEPKSASLSDGCTPD